MTQKGEFYRCQVCDNLVEVTQSGEGELICCQVPMDLLEARDEGTGKEKHKPILADEDEVVVKVGENPHPMDEDHCIQWIEIQADDQVIRQILEAGDQPLARFKLDPEKVKKLTLRSYCNIHGLWES